MGKVIMKENLYLLAIREDEDLRNSSEEELRETYHMMPKVLKIRMGK
ncbi:MAG: hypothetical protein PF489_12375 [Salinivirgaceae bacterium]|jgi:hypothetical protein|nr:hypothetical protein [Salinivirgaceae bacterium]